MTVILPSIRRQATRTPHVLKLAPPSLSEAGESQQHAIALMAIGYPSGYQPRPTSGILEEVHSTCCRRWHLTCYRHHICVRRGSAGETPNLNLKDYSILSSKFLILESPPRYGTDRREVIQIRSWWAAICCMFSVSYCTCPGLACTLT